MQNKALILIIICALSTSVLSQEIRTCKVYQYKNEDSMNKEVTLIRLYDSLGMLTQEVYQGFEDSTVDYSANTYYYYNNKRKLVRKLFIDTEWHKNDTAETLYSYDKSKQLVLETTYYYLRPAPGIRDIYAIDTILKHYQYDPYGRIMLTKRSSNGKVFENHYFIYENTRIAKDSLVHLIDTTRSFVGSYNYFDNDYTYKRVYNDRNMEGNIYPITCIDSFFTYNNVNVTHSEYVLDEISNQKLMWKINRYYSNGRLTKTVLQRDENTIITSLYEYE